MKLEVGMYVRFNDLTNYSKNNIVMIDKIKFISEVMCGLEETLSITFEKYNEDVLKKDIIKASHNIIDLIEVGDYVNGNPVCQIKKDDHNRIWIYTDSNYKYGYLEEDIVDVVTKEQFSREKYIVKEWLNNEFMD